MKAACFAGSLFFHSKFGDENGDVFCRNRHRFRPSEAFGTILVTVFAISVSFCVPLSHFPDCFQIRAVFGNIFGNSGDKVLIEELCRLLIRHQYLICFEELSGFRISEFGFNCYRTEVVDRTDGSVSC